MIDDYAENTQSREQAEAVMRTKLLAGDAADLYYFRSDLLSPLPWIAAGLLYDLGSADCGGQRNSAKKIIIRMDSAARIWGTVSLVPYVWRRGR